MKLDCTAISYLETGMFSSLATDYLAQAANLNAFYTFSPNEAGLEQAIAARGQYNVNRALLVSVLKEQYQNYTYEEAVQKNIEALNDPNTFTVCTAHQPNLLSGYLYFFYKILHAIKLAEELRQRYPSKYFVPVYYMGSEDNDLAELGQFWYAGQKYNWEAQGQKGAVGRMDTSSLKPLLDELFRYLGPLGPLEEELKTVLQEAYLKRATIADATIHLVHHFFKAYGLLVLQPDDARFKSLFKAVMQDDLLQHSALDIVQAQSHKLAQHYKAQAYPRAINLFYLKDALRERIEKVNDEWHVLNSSIRFDKEALLAELEQHPERFSPNVILRGLFQETILPNIAFIGGGAELAYWLQLKPLFEKYNVFYPLILLRQSVQILTPKTYDTFKKLKIDWAQAFQTKDTIIKQWTAQLDQQQWSIEKEQQQILNALEAIQQKLVARDKGLKASSIGVKINIEKQLAHLDNKIFKAQKNSIQQDIERLETFIAHLKPNGILQERIENFMPYFLSEGFPIFDFIKNHINALQPSFLIIHPKD